MKVGIIVSTPFEAKVFGLTMAHASVQPFDQGVIACCGPGKSGVDKAILHLSYHEVDGLISWGFAGGLVPYLDTGAMICPRQVLHPVGPTLDVSLEWHEKMVKTLSQQQKVSTRPIMHSDQVLLTVQEKKIAHERTQAAAVDQESFYITQWAYQLGLPVVCVRVILDDLFTELPNKIDHVLNDKGRLNKAALFKILAKPSNWPNILKLQNQYKVSHQELKQAAHIAFYGQR